MTPALEDAVCQYARRDGGQERAIAVVSGGIDEPGLGRSRAEDRQLVARDGTQTRAFTHIDDMIDGLMLVVERGEHLNIYHVGNPEELTIGDVARQVVACFGREARIVPSELPQGSTNRRCPDIGKLKALGFEPKIPFAQGVKPVVDWYREHGHLRPKAAA